MTVDPEAREALLSEMIEAYSAEINHTERPHRRPMRAALNVAIPPNAVVVQTEGLAQKLDDALRPIVGSSWALEAVMNVLAALTPPKQETSGDE